MPFSIIIQGTIRGERSGRTARSIVPEELLDKIAALAQVL